MEAGHSGEPGTGALGRVELEIKLDSGHVPILLQ